MVLTADRVNLVATTEGNFIVFLTRCFNLGLRSSLGHLNKCLNFPNELKHFTTLVGVEENS